MNTKKVDKIMPYVFPIIVIGVLILYYLVNPMQSNFPIKCPWYLLTGTQCPACGSQRALHTLLNGSPLDALRYNYFFVFSIPYIFLAIVATWYNYHHVFDKLRTLVYHRITLRIYIALYFGWWIVRNLYEI